MTGKASAGRPEPMATRVAALLDELRGMGSARDRAGMARYAVQARLARRALPIARG